MKNLPKSKVFKIIDSIPLKEHHTISKSLSNNADLDFMLFSLAKDTDISKEHYNNQSIFYVLKGSINILDKFIKEDNIFITPKESLRGVSTKEDSVYLEISFNGDDFMKNIEKGQVINLKDQIDYIYGGISNLDIVSKDGIKIMLMAFDKGEGLSDHAAPGDAMVIALEGSADLKVGDEIHEIKAGEQLVFPKNITHNVFAKEKFKMALILVRD
ncbi:cupin domain-containing protein [Peptoniphilus stercorisuis]|uniref:Quercetin dioxygenase-like cupin family protein n=1 Tax=Peptoniphilus stercorisuis TaxID=1436965 RepID=A0ABS4K9V5_9FIRM|nr:cupin domain-containing protein [Peptoniphilus stercorisuis]MBP2024560.1 quercetin dioxygenase-like cupin family protein [Peptoniphilus stercorisuis]